MLDTESRLCGLELDGFPHSSTGSSGTSACSCPSRKEPQSALHQHVHHGFTIGSRTTDIVDRVGSCSSQFGGMRDDSLCQFLAGQISLGFGSMNDGRSDGAQRDDR